MRYTKNRLQEDIDKINGWLKDDGSTVRLEAGGRNGYTAVDQYSVDSDCNRIGSGVDRNVCCGSPRECCDAAHDVYNIEYRKIKNRHIDNCVDFARKVVSLLDDESTDSNLFLSRVTIAAQELGLW